MDNKLQFDVARAGVIALLSLALFAPAAKAAENTNAERVPLQQMNQAEYEAYREQLRQHENGVEKNAAAQQKATEDKETVQQERKANRGGYGQGYRTRTERGGAHNGMMNRGAMRK